MKKLKKNMYEAIEMHIQGLLEDNLSIPESKSFAEYVAVVAIYQSNGWWAIKYNFNSTSNFAGANKWIAFGNGTAQPVVGNFNNQ